MVHVWYVRSPGPAEGRLLTAWSRLLSEEERERAARFMREGDRATYVAAHAMLRVALSRSAPLEPEAWRFRTGPHGRPEIDGPAERHGLRFSLSHTAGFAICAITTDVPVGVDVEATGRRTPLDVAQRCFAPEERDALDALPPPRRPERFLEHWTLKEAFLKALGVGLTYPMSRVRFTLVPGAPVRVAVPPDLETDPEAWRFESWRPDEGYLAALAVRSEGAPCEMRAGPCEMPGPEPSAG
jgi:4'-phosphopantetheinyl transferase